ncbi:MAG: hypothetical protein ACLR4Z_14915 [Butyricicoccaceae bacterium]
MKGVPLWIRHVVVPGLTDSLDHLPPRQGEGGKLSELRKARISAFPQAVHRKYDRLGLEFPLRDTPAMTNERLSELLAQL